ncbi:LysM peptidoglycan-binding domain-containing protein [Silvibacterium dinghuense]|uniref:LysM peptidoglycan-binding domain-containing protein n=1 Tax=Silvibacterium dinghuense TaxID=1560006 RepID=A0A4Q1SKH1_9BACT|nr:LysM peptidoglycan-binding domain-containing protein [Silvibacterium dinghuense]
MIQSVEKAYQNGVSNYQQGHLEAARSNFDYAVDQMLTCGIPIKNDPDLSAEFDHIVDAVNTLEMDALTQGNGLSAPADPTPAEAAEQATFKVDPTVVAEAQAALKTTQSDLPLVINDTVAGYIDFFTKSRAGHATIVASLQRAGLYRDMIQKVLKREGLPQDLIYLAFAESGFRPRVVNAGSGAGGMWQFMPWGVYGLDRNGWYDERFDPEKATEAYARLIKANYDQLGDWYLAIAAYNWGAGAVQRAVQRTGYADFWELYRRNNLPEQTKQYVPEIIAVALIAKNPKQYGLDSIVPDQPIVTDTVQTNYSVSLQLAADIVGSTASDLADLNPSLLRGVTPPDESFDLHLPAGTKELFEKRIAAIPEDRRRYWRFHAVHAGDTLEEVAREYHVSASEIAAENQIAGGSDLSGLDAVVIPVSPVTAPVRKSALYVTRRGDSLITVADRFNVTVEDLKAWNHLSSSAVPAGRRLYISEPAHVSSARRTERGAATQAHRTGKEKAGVTKAGSAKTGSTKAGTAKGRSTSEASASTKRKPRHS